MPPPIEDEEDTDPDEPSSSEQSARDATVLSNAEGLIGTSHSARSRVSPERVVSDIPLVVSDIQPTKEMATSEPISQEFGDGETKKGNRRALPCVYCARRLANDPKWACHDAVVSQDGKPGYTGTRCSECVGSHVSCCILPPKAVGPVKALVKAAEEVEKPDGNQNIAVLAAYEAAIGPALRAMVGIGLQSSAKVNEPKKRSRQPKNKKKGKDRRQPSVGNVAENGGSPQVSSHRFELGGSDTRSRPDHENGDSQGVNLDSQPLSKSLQADHGQGPDDLYSAAFQKTERQALRRRKVEALESLAHTAALFLAEFTDFKNGWQGPPATKSPPSGLERHQADPRAGTAYAAAAASLFQPFSEEFDRRGYESGGSVMEQPSSNYDSSDDEIIPSENHSEQKEGMSMDMDDRESDETPSELLASMRNGEQANGSEPGVKVEEH